MKNVIKVLVALLLFAGGFWFGQEYKWVKTLRKQVEIVTQECGRSRYSERWANPWVPIEKI